MYHILSLSLSLFGEPCGCWPARAARMPSIFGIAPGRPEDVSNDNNDHDNDNNNNHNNNNDNSI